MGRHHQSTVAVYRYHLVRSNQQQGLLTKLSTIVASFTNNVQTGLNQIQPSFHRPCSVAIITGATHHQVVARYMEVLLTCQLGNEVIQFRGCHFDHLVAECAVQVRVLRVAIVMIVYHPFAQRYASKQTRFHEFSQRAINCPQLS